MLGLESYSLINRKQKMQPKGNGVFLFLSGWKKTEIRVHICISIIKEHSLCLFVYFLYLGWSTVTFFLLTNSITELGPSLSGHQRNLSPQHSSSVPKDETVSSDLSVISWTSLIIRDNEHKMEMDQDPNKIIGVSIGTVLTTILIY